MTNDDILNVWYERILVGKLWRDESGKMGFRYDENWLNNYFSISQQLPLTFQEYLPAEGKAHRFFVNLLPEANARSKIVKDLKISNSDFELLKAIGGECAGAFSILPSDKKIDVPFHYQRLTHDQLEQILRRKGQVFNLATKDERPRLSLAGAQDKCAVLFDGQDYYLPNGAAPSTHILKFEVAGFRNIPVYEYYLNQLAKAIALPVVDIQLKQHEKEHYLLIKRYDRMSIGPLQVQRLHQEDFCQALGIGYEKKYQQEGGPTFQHCYAFIQRVSANPIQDAENLLKWQIFNFFAGNADGHAKNLAVIYQKNRQVTLAPFYDLVCTRAVERLDVNLAMSVGGVFNPSAITFYHWEILAKECEVRWNYLKQAIQQIAESLLENIEITLKQFENLYGAFPALQRVQHIITKQCNKTLKQLK